MEFVERVLEAAAKRGEFDAGPRSGTALSVDDASAGWWARREVDRLWRDDHRRAVVQEVDRKLGEAWTLPSESAVRALVPELNARLIEAGCVGLLDVDETVRVWKRMARIRRS